MFENSFSRRKGYTPPPGQGKLEELSDHARNRLWGIFHRQIYERNFSRGFGETIPSSALSRFFETIWEELYHHRIDEYPGPQQVLFSIKDVFFRGVWHLPFDIFEAAFESQGIDTGNLVVHPDQVASEIRNVLERENQAYNFVGGRFVERMTSEETESVETALKTPIEAIREHFQTALRMLSDRDNPDPRNSIKESISAVEAACNHVTFQTKATLEAALKTLHNRKPLHPAFKDSLSKLYAWTSDENGVRHALMEAEKLESVDAQFMLVVCSAFVNYLMTR